MKPATKQSGTAQSHWNTWKWPTKNRDCNVVRVFFTHHHWEVYFFQYMDIFVWAHTGHILIWPIWRLNKKQGRQIHHGPGSMGGDPELKALVGDFVAKLCLKVSESTVGWMMSQRLRISFRNKKTSGILWFCDLFLVWLFLFFFRPYVKPYGNSIWNPSRTEWRTCSRPARQPCRHHCWLSSFRLA